MALVRSRSDSCFARWALFATLLAGAGAAGCDSGGSGTANSAVGCNDPLLVEDFEDGDGRICSGGGQGAWFTAGDGTSFDLKPALGGTFTPTLIPGGRDGSTYAAHMTGSGFTIWGAMMGFRLNGSATEPYDASKVSGVTFWMKSNVPIYLSLSIPATLPVASGGTCTDGPNDYNCFNHQSISISPPADDSKWVKYKVPFVALGQHAKNDANGNTVFGSASFTPESLLEILFAAPAHATFDVWVDDIGFYSCEGSECVPTCANSNLPIACPALGAQPASCWAAGTDCSKTATWDQDFFGVWGSGPTDVWAAGYSYASHSGALLHWDGSTWSASPSGTTAILSGLWGSGPDDVWAVGDYGVALHWDGTRWASVPTGSMQSLSRVWGSAANDVWAVGHGGTVLHWDGSAWSTMVSHTTVWLTDVWGSGAGDVWAVGSAEDGSASEIVHWDGSAFAVVPSDAAPGLFGLWGSGPNDVWAVGPGIRHWDGARWSDSPTGTTGKAFYGIWGSAANDVWAVGGDTKTGDAEFVHWNGSSWSSVPAGSAGFPYALWGSGPKDIWSVGFGSTLDHWDGSAWKAAPLSASP